MRSLNVYITQRAHQQPIFAWRGALQQMISSLSSGSSEGTLPAHTHPTELLNLFSLHNLEKDSEATQLCYPSPWPSETFRACPARLMLPSQGTLV